jgi:hypothetical protein
MVYGNETYKEGYELYYEAFASSPLNKIDYTFTFIADNRFGSFTEPVVITLPQEGEQVTPPHILSAYPNPFNPQATIEFNLPEAGEVKLKVYDLKGQLLETLINGHREAGEYITNWNADKAVSGIYFLRLESNNINEVKRLVLLK